MVEQMRQDPAREDELILVDALDRPIGQATKERAHREGLLHRAFSVVLVRYSQTAAPEILLTQRAACKYHSGGLWTNSCCSHPRAGEELRDAVPRRVREELGVCIGDPEELGSFVYRAEFPDGLCEYEYDHVFVATCEQDVHPDPGEVDGVRWVTVEGVAAELTEHPERFTAWAFTVLAGAIAHLNGKEPTEN